MTKEISFFCGQHKYLNINDDNDDSKNDDNDDVDDRDDHNKDDYEKKKKKTKPNETKITKISYSNDKLRPKSQLKVIRKFRPHFNKIVFQKKKPD